MKLRMALRIAGWMIIAASAVVAFGWAVGGLATGILLTMETILDEYEGEL